jgi:predicted PurR-regulated permease PerM
MASNGRAADLGLVAKRTLVVLGLVALALMVWQLAVMLLLVFGGVLIGVFLRGLVDGVAARTPLNRTAALVLIVLSIVTFLSAGGILFGAQMMMQFGELSERIATAVQELEKVLRNQPWSAWLLTQADDMEPGDLVGNGVPAHLAGAAAYTAEAIINVLFLLVVGLYLAASPEPYRRGLVRLVPPRNRPRAEAVLDEIDHSLWNWLVGQFVAMLLVGSLCGLGLVLLGVPMALSLGVLAAVLNFVPVVGPIVAAVPAILVGFTQGATTALYVALLYLAVQQIESYAIMPMVQRWAVALPPVLTLAAIIAFGVLFGVWGVIFATPLLVAVMVVVRMLYVEDVLERRTERVEALLR